jgi:hypothetical protein
MNNVKKFLSEINKVYDCDNLTKFRIGNKSDGGYVLLKELCDRIKTIYTFGVGNDVSFELDFIERYPDTWFKMFDPTINRLPTRHNRFVFYKSDIQALELSEIPEDSLLKMDVEYSEWEDLLTLNEKVYKKFSQMLIEFHIVDVPDKQGLSSYFSNFYKEIYRDMNNVLFGFYYRVLQGLNELFYISHIHANNSLPKIEVGGCRFPPLLEVSFVRKDLVGDVVTTHGDFPLA